MKEVTFKIEYGGSCDVLDAIESCNQALEDAGIPVEFVIDDNEHDGFEVVTLKAVEDIEYDA